MKVKLTEKKIRSLAGTGTAYDILHDRTPSAGLRLSALGAKIWFYLYRSPIVRDERGQPKQRRAYLGYHPSGRRPDRQAEGRDLVAMTLDQFETAYDVFRGELARGNDPQELKGARPEMARWIGAESIPDLVRPLLPEGCREGTFGHLMLDYFLHHAGVHLKLRTTSGYVQAAKSFASVLGSRSASEISDQDVRVVLTSVERRAPQMVRGVRAVLSAIFEYGRSHWHLSGNPARGIRVMVKKAKRDRWLKDGELVSAFGAFGGLSDGKVEDVYRLVLYSLCRPGEAAYARAEDIVLSNGERVWRIRGKNGNEFLVPLLGPIGEILQRRCREVGSSGPLFWKGDASKTYPTPLRAGNVKFRRLSLALARSRCEPPATTTRLPWLKRF